MLVLLMECSCGPRVVQLACMVLFVEWILALDQQGIVVGDIVRLRGRTESL